MLLVIMIETGNVVAIEGNSLTTGSLLRYEIPFIKFNRRCFSYDGGLKMSKGKGIVMGLSEITHKWIRNRYQ